MMNDVVTYNHTFDLSYDKNDGAAFPWSITDEGKGMNRPRSTDWPLALSLVG